MVEREPVGDPGAAVVAHDGEALVAERGHQLHQLRRHLPLRVALAPRAARGRPRGAVAAQVGRHDRVIPRQPRRDAMPARVRLREAVEEQDGRAVAARGHVVLGRAHRVAGLGEAFEPHRRADPDGSTN